LEHNSCVGGGFGCSVSSLGVDGDDFGVADDDDNDEWGMINYCITHVLMVVLVVVLMTLV
jgi:hypothetical protein